jgi:hypothetical protein
MSSLHRRTADPGKDNTISRSMSDDSRHQQMTQKQIVIAQASKGTIISQLDSENGVTNIKYG